ncbi:hypothetical protein M5689_004548 [Euphorbia peplus]|nr:hypothetical protein M5689_004548 [Euphorbia peplus]
MVGFDQLQRPLQTITTYMVTNGSGHQSLGDFWDSIQWCSRVLTWLLCVLGLKRESFGPYLNWPEKGMETGSCVIPTVLKRTISTSLSVSKGTSC